MPCRRRQAFALVMPQCKNANDRMGRWRFSMMEIDHAPMSGVDGVLDAVAGTMCVAFNKKATRMLDCHAQSVVLGIRCEIDGVPMFIPKARMESVLVDDDDADLLRAVFRFEPKDTTFKRPN